MEFQKLINRAMDLRGQYAKKETELYGSPATDEDIAQGFSGDVNNLIKLILAERGKRTIANSKEKLEAQLAHCLWSVIVLAKCTTLIWNNLSWKRWIGWKIIYWKLRTDYTSLRPG